MAENIEEYNEDELSPPDWLNEAFIRRVLRSRQIGNGADLKITDLAITPATQKGDHYASLMFRATYKYSADELTGVESVVIKTMPEMDTEKGRNLGDGPLFETEEVVYREVIPGFEEIWREHGEEIKFAGRLLYATTKPYRVIVLEDLRPLGYDILRGSPYMLNEARTVLRKLAKWHAVSHKVAVESDPKWSSLAATVKGLQDGLFKMQQLIATPILSNGMQNLIAVLEEKCGDEPEYVETYLPKLRALAPQLVARCIAMQEAHTDGVAGPIYVLNHGDFHAKNIMFRPGPNGIMDAEDFLFVDYQVNFFGTSTYDIRYAMYALVGEKPRDNQHEELLPYYFECFANSLKQLQFRGKLPTYVDFKADLHRWRCYELFCVSTLLPFCLYMEKFSMAPDPIQIFGSEEYRKSFYRHPLYLEKVKKLLPKLLSEGYLEE